MVIFFYLGDMHAYIASMSFGSPMYSMGDSILVLRDEVATRALFKPHKKHGDITSKDRDRIEMREVIQWFLLVMIFPNENL